MYKHPKTFLKYLSVSALVSFAATLAHSSSKFSVTGDDGMPHQTQNHHGIQFPPLGNYEDLVLQEVRGVALNEDQGTPTVLIIGDAYGRLAGRVISESSADTTVVVNELSTDNICGFLGSLLKQDPRVRGRTLLDVGDCLQILSRPATRNVLVDSKTGAGRVDMIICNNVIHFFGGGQVLDLYLLMSRILKPSGQAYMFAESQARTMTQSEALSVPNPGLFEEHLRAKISGLARQNGGSTIFPGIFRRSWMLGREQSIDMLMRMGNGNANTLANTIPKATHHVLANAIGFSMQTIGQYDFMHLSMLRSSVLAPNAQGTYLAFSLTRDTGAKTERQQLDQQLVNDCDHAAAQMEQFVRTRVKTTPIFPLILDDVNPESASSH